MKLKYNVIILMHLFLIASCDKPQVDTYNLPYDKKTSKTALFTYYHDDSFASYAPNLEKSENGDIKLTYPKKNKGLEGVYLALWEDGTIIWSVDPKYDQAPFNVGKIPHFSKENITKRLKEFGFFDLKRRHHFMFNSGTIKLAYTEDDTIIYLESYHELFEANPNLVVTHHGIQSLEGQLCSQVIGDSTEEYKQFRETWDNTKHLFLQMIPDPIDYMDENQIIAKPVKLKSKRSN